MRLGTRRVAKQILKRRDACARFLHTVIDDKNHTYLLVIDEILRHT